jgi:DNA-binding IclR family transcriptional regulator
MGDHTIPVLKKAIAVLREIAAGGETGTKALALQTGVPHTTAYRILRTLIAEDWVRPAHGGRHELSLGLLPLLQPLVRHELLVETARPALQKLAAETGLSAKLSVRQGDHAFALLRAESPRETSIAVRVGASFPLALGSSGAVLIADLPPTERRTLLDRAPAECWTHQKKADVEARVSACRRNGYCGDFGGYRPNVYALSAPVRDRGATIVGAITLVGFPQDFTGRRRATLARLLLAAAASCGALPQPPVSSAHP